MTDLLQSEGYSEKQYRSDNTERGEESEEGLFSIFSREAREENDESEHIDRVVLTNLSDKVIYDNYRHFT